MPNLHILRLQSNTENEGIEICTEFVVGHDGSGQLSRESGTTAIARSSKQAVVSERIPAGLRVDSKAMRPFPDLDARAQVSVLRIEGINLGMVAAREPQGRAVNRDSPHVRAAAARNHPLGDRL